MTDATAGYLADLHLYLREGREALLWKLDGLSEYDVRRPLVPTGTNLLGLVKHLAMVEAGYFGVVFGRPVGGFPVWDDDDPNADLWVTPDESREYVLDLYRRAGEHADATIAALPADAPGRVPWWREGGRDVTLHRILVHVATETHRHAGHADLLRELVDGAAGHRPGSPNLWDPQDSWAAHRQRVEEAARRFS